MSAPQGCTDDMGVVESFKEALRGRVGADRYRMWFTHGVGFSVRSCEPRSCGPGAASTEGATDKTIAGDESDTPSGDGSSNPFSEERVGGSECFAVEPGSVANVEARPTLIVSVRGQFALDRLKKNFLNEIRGAAMHACGSRMEVELCLDERLPHQIELPLEDGGVLDPERLSLGSESNQRTGVACSSSSSVRRYEDRASRDHTGREYTGRDRTGRDHTGRGGATTSMRRLMAGAAIGSQPRRGASVRRSGRPSVSSSSPDQLSFPELETSRRPETEPSQQHDRKATRSEDGSPSHGDDGQSQGAGAAKSLSHAMSLSNFIAGPCNRLAYTAMEMACQDPSTATPLFLCGPTGTGKTHLLSAIAEQLRRRHRLRRVIHLSAEQFTNDFLGSVGTSGITAFRRRYREVDALLIDDVQFLGAKKATLREMLYTVETLTGSRRPLVFSGSHAPTEIEGLTKELAGRMAAGLVCVTQPLDVETREKLLRRWITERCHAEVPDSLIEAINPLLAGDGRVISGIVNVLNTLQRMLRRTPTLDELRQHAGQLLRAAKPLTTLSVIELAVCEAFQLPADSLRGKSQTRAVTGPRMLAMYLSRQLTSAAYAEIARHFGGRSHSTAISAEQNVKGWLAEGADVGRGQAAMSAREAIDRVEALLRSG